MKNKNFISSIYLHEDYHLNFCIPLVPRMVNVKADRRTILQKFTIIIRVSAEYLRKIFISNTRQATSNVLRILYLAPRVVDFVFFTNLEKIVEEKALLCLQSFVRRYILIISSSRSRLSM